MSFLVRNKASVCLFVCLFVWGNQSLNQNARNAISEIENLNKYVYKELGIPNPEFKLYLFNGDNNLETASYKLTGVKMLKLGNLGLNPTQSNPTIFKTL